MRTRHCRLPFPLWIALVGGVFCGTARGESVRLSWDPSAEIGVVGYNVYRASVPGGPYILLNPSPIGMPSYYDDSAEPGRTYYYSVTAVGLGGESRYSSEAVFTTGSYELVPHAATLETRAVPDVVASSGETVILSSGAWNPTNAKLTYQWTQLSGPAVSISGRTSAEASFIAPYLTQDTQFSFGVIVTDGSNAIAGDVLQVLIQRQ